MSNTNKRDVPGLHRLTLELTVDEADLLLKAWGYLSAIGLLRLGHVPRELVVDMGTEVLAQWLKSPTDCATLSAKTTEALYIVADAKGHGKMLREFGEMIDKVLDGEGEQPGNPAL